VTVSPAAIAEAAAVLRQGGLVAFPTETVYGLGADATNVAAVERVFVVKGRPAGHPLIVHLAQPSQLDDWTVDVAPEARALAGAHWPGPLTLLLPRSTRVPDAVTGGRPTVGVRVPSHPVAAALLDAFGGGVGAPSANRFGEVSPTTADHVRADLGADVDLVLDGGHCTVGVESTIVDCSVRPPMILRHGAVTAEQIRVTLHGEVDEVARGASRAPGMLESHYAPHATVELAESEEAAEGRRAHHAGAGRRVDVLSPRTTVAEYAHHLYDWLRAADERHLDVLVVVPPPAVGVGVAVNERLAKASGRRE
jgi:L-threonylcarbamoyladenylate synthase